MKTKKTKPFFTDAEVDYLNKLAFGKKPRTKKTTK